MKINQLGQTGIKVSRICFGSLTIGPLQKNKSLKESRKIIELAISLGINFFDTADLYNNYDHLSQAIEIKKDVIISTKSYDYTKEGLEDSVNRALRELNRDYIDIYMLHEQENEKTIQGHWQAIERLIKYKEQGVVRAIGISTHRIEGVIGATKYSELEVIHPLINLTGIGIEDGTNKEMEVAIKTAKKAGKGIYAMKPLGGGNLLSRKEECFDYILGLETLDAIAIGIQSIDEVLYNVKKFNGENIEKDLKERVEMSKKSLVISDWCSGCGECVKHCHQQAISIIDKKAIIDHKKCVLCCYCSQYCKYFCIKVI